MRLERSLPTIRPPNKEVRPKPNNDAPIPVNTNINESKKDTGLIPHLIFASIVPIISINTTKTSKNAPVPFNISAKKHAIIAVKKNGILFVVEA